MNKQNDKMEYYKGLPKGTYNEALGELAKTPVNSYETSSITLADFWRPGNLPRIQDILSPHLPGIDLESSLKFFEFATDPVLRGEVCSEHPSMTDLMVLHPNDWQIAIEAKYTEYVDFSTETCADWLEGKRKKGYRLAKYRNILRAWVEMIKDSTCTAISLTDFYETCMGIGYQFLHRTASACFKTNGSECTTPVLVYQLFYKKGNSEHVAKMEAFKDDLRSWAKMLGLKNMKFLIVSVPVVNWELLNRRYGHLNDSRAAVLFDVLKNEDVHEFDFKGITVETVVDKEVK